MTSPLTMSATCLPQTAPSIRFGTPLRPLEPKFFNIIINGGGNNNNNGNNGHHSRKANIKQERKLSNSSSAAVPMEYLPRSPSESFSSQDSYTEYESAQSTAPSSPRTPDAKMDMADRQLPHYAPRTLSLRPEMDCHRPQLPPVRRASCEARLPSLNSFMRASAAENHEQSSGRLHIASRAPRTPDSDSWKSSDYGFSKDATSPSSTGDKITDTLNELRLKDGKAALDAPSEFKSLSRMDLARPRYFRTPDYDPLRHVQEGDIRKHRSRPLNSIYDMASFHSARQGQMSPRRLSKLHRAAPTAHCNKRYSSNQMDFIRYHQVDLKLSWNEIRDQFAVAFPNEEHYRDVQGLQGVYYRWNKEIPKLDLETNMLKFQRNGHVQKETRKVREQSDAKKQYGLLNLYPERAMYYEWVRPEDRQRAAEINEPRQRAREEAKREAIKRGDWEESPPEGECACCVHSKRAKL